MNLITGAVQRLLRDICGSTAALFFTIEKGKKFQVMLKHSKVVLICLAVSSCIGTDVVDDLIGPDLSKLTVDPHSISLPIGAQSQLMAIYLDYTGQPAETTILWHSRNENVASV